MFGDRAAISLLLDATVWIRGTTGGDDGNPQRTAVGNNGLTFKADRVEVESSFTTEDHSTAQDTPEFMRITKKPQRIVIETKLEKKADAALNTLLLSAEGVVVQFIVTADGASLRTKNAPSMGTPLGGALVEGYELAYSGPSTLRLVLRQYGTPFDLLDDAKLTLPGP
jgi:hypothetical protein